MTPRMTTCPAQSNEWHTTRLSRVLFGLKDGTHGTFERLADGPPLLSAKNVLDGRLDITESESRISEEDHRSIVANGYPKTGDVLLTIVGSIGRACVFEQDEPVAFQRSVAFLRFGPGHVPRYFAYALQSKLFQEELAIRSKASAQSGVYLTDVGAAQISWPVSPAKQAAIASFLDRETARIDALIEKKSRFIELLREKRQALITRAVTRGLEPGVPFKDSGVDTLGEVPAHYRISRLMHLTAFGRDIMYGIVLPGPNVEEGIPIVKGGNVKAERLRLDQLARTTVEIEAPFARARLRPNDIVYSIRGSIGDAELVPEELLDANITQDVARVSPGPGASARWLLYVLKSTAIFTQLDRDATGATIRGINIFSLKRVLVPVPPLAEQESIAAYLDQRLAEMDRLAGATERSVRLLMERRAALIAAAVTGQIDVREAV